MDPKTKVEARQAAERKDMAARAARKAEASDRDRHNVYRADQHAATAVRFETEAARLRALLPALPD